MGGTGVADAQRALIARGINLPTGADGYYNDLTVYAVQTFQRSVGLAPKGHIDEQTARALGLIGATWPTVARGTTGAATVRLIETALIGRGIAVRGGVDGVFDIWLEYAVKTFQRQNGLAVSGIVDIATAARLGLTRAPAPGSVWTAVSNGSTGLLVSRTQQALVDHGIAVSSGVTGHFDIYTLYAVQTYQRHHGLLATGVVDVETARSLGLLDPDGNPVATWVDLGLGAAGEPVRTAERCLAAARIRVADGIDGIFKLGDFYAVQTFQRWRSGGLPVTGRIDLASADRLGMLETPVPCVPPVALAATVAADDRPRRPRRARRGRPRRRRPWRRRWRAISDPSTTTTTSTTSTGSTSPPTSTTSTDPTTSTTLAAPTTTSTAGGHDRSRPGGVHGERGVGHDRRRRRRRARRWSWRRQPPADSTAPATTATTAPTTVVDSTAAPVETTARRRGDRAADHRRHPNRGDRRLTTAGRAPDRSVTPSPIGPGHRTLAAVRPPRDFFRPLAVGAPAPVREIPFRPSRMIHFLPPSNPKMVAKVPRSPRPSTCCWPTSKTASRPSEKEAAHAGLVAIGRAWDHPTRSCGRGSTRSTRRGRWTTSSRP